MSEPTVAPTETILKNAYGVTLGEKDYTISTFKFGKSLMAMRLFADLALAAGLSEAAKGLLSPGPRASEDDSLDGADTPDELLSVSGLISKLLEVIPTLLVQAPPTVYRLIALIVTSNKELRDWEKDDKVNVLGRLEELGGDIASEADTAEILNLFNTALPLMGIETVVRSVAPLLASLRRT